MSISTADLIHLDKSQSNVARELGQREREQREVFSSNTKQHQGHEGRYGAQERGSGDIEVKARVLYAEKAT